MSQVGLCAGSDGVDGLGLATLGVPHLEHGGAGGAADLDDILLLIVPVDLTPAGGCADGPGQLGDVLEARTLGEAKGGIGQEVVAGDEGASQLEGVGLLGYPSDQGVDLLGNSGHDYLLRTLNGVWVGAWKYLPLSPWEIALKRPVVHS